MARTKWGFLPAQMLNGCAPVVKFYPLASGTYYEGSVLRVSGTSGSGKLAAAGGTTMLGISKSYVTTANSTSGVYPIQMFTGDEIFEAKMLATSVPQQKVGDVVDLAVGSTHNFRVSATAVGATGVATAPFVIYGYHADEAATTHTGVRYYVKPNNFVFSGGRRVS